MGQKREVEKENNDKSNNNGNSNIKNKNNSHSNNSLALLRYTKGLLFSAPVNGRPLHG